MSNASGRSDRQWANECIYISAVADQGGKVPEMNNDPATFRRYCEMQRDQARKDSQHDAAEYISQCMEDIPND